MGRRELRVASGLALVMSGVLVLGILVASSVIDLPGNWRVRLGFDEGTPDNPCHLGLYRKSPGKQPAAAGRWRFETSAPRSQVEGSAIAIGRRIYVAGGSAPGNLHRMLAYDTGTGRWSEPTKLPAGLNHSQLARYRGDLYLAGGYLEGLEAKSSLWRYDPDTNEWAELPPMSQPRGAAAAAVIDDKLYVADGGPQVFAVSDPGGPYDSLEIYDFGSESWSRGPDAPFALHHVNGAVLGGRLYMAGGRVTPEQSSDNFMRYDPRAELWERLPSLPQGAVASAGVVAASGRIVVFGGDEELGWEDGGGWVTPSAWAFEPRTRRWRRLPDLTIERHAFGAAVAGGRIYAIAGAICPGIKPTGPVGTHTVESLPVSALDQAAPSP